MMILLHLYDLVWFASPFWTWYVELLAGFLSITEPERPLALVPVDWRCRDVGELHKRRARTQQPLIVTSTILYSITGSTSSRTRSAWTFKLCKTTSLSIASY